MNHPPQDMITTAVRVLADDARTKVAAEQLLRGVMIQKGTHELLGIKP